ncbi:putative DWNN domain-containing protein [Seiridium cardinale]
MTSSVFYKFKSQKEPSRVEFDGTGISVFELKRDIIKLSGLGDGTDFDFAIYTEDGAEEYEDDLAIIPRSTTVIARRLPPAKPGAGRAARYVSGKMPHSAKNSSRREATAKITKPSTQGLAQMSSALTEEEKLAAMFQVQSDQWTAQQEEMANQAPVYKPGSKKPVNVPDHEPPKGYVCYRCGQIGHWIQVCPTNDNPEFDNRPRVKRTTGIPRSFLKTVDKATLQQGEGEDGVKPPAGVMVNADGDYVIAEPDKASWEQFQAKSKTSASAQKAASDGDKELEEKGLLCTLDKKLFIDPVTTPCCEKTFCNECITNALIESDFVCPSCQTEGVLIDDLKPDDQTTTKVQDYLKEKDQVKRERSKSPITAQSPVAEQKDNGEATTNLEQAGSSPGKHAQETEQAETADNKKSPTPVPEQARSPSIATTKKSASPTATPQPATNGEGPNKPQELGSKKRSAEEPLESEPKIPKGPKAMRQQEEQQRQQQVMMQQMMGMGQMPMNPMMFPNFPNMGGMNMNMGMGMPNMSTMPNMPNMPMMPMGMMNPMMGMGGFNQNGGFPNMNGFNNFNGGGMNGMGGNMNSNRGGFQQGPTRPNFSQPNSENDAYFRQPVNPNRHQNRRVRNRPSDYREL